MNSYVASLCGDVENDHKMAAAKWRYFPCWGHNCKSKSLTCHKILTTLGDATLDNKFQASKKRGQERSAPPPAPAATRPQTAIQYIVDEILTLRCPNKHAFVDYDGCAVLTCKHCQVVFCAICLGQLAKDNKTSHEHARDCINKHTTDKTKSAFVSMQVFTTYHNKVKHDKIQKFMSTFSNAQRQSIGMELYPLVKDFIPFGPKLMTYICEQLRKQVEEKKRANEQARKLIAEQERELELQEARLLKKRKVVVDLT